MLTGRPFLALLLALLPAPLACGSGADSGGGGGDTSAGGSSFADVEASMQSTCASSACHGGTSPPDLRTGNAYDALINVTSTYDSTQTLVIPGDSANSYLVKKISGASGITGVPMPSGSSAWDSHDVNMVRDWIDAGASRN